MDELLTQAGDSVKGIYMSFGGLPESELSAEGQEFIEKYEQKYDDEFSPTPPTPTRRPTSCSTPSSGRPRRLAATCPTGGRCSSRCSRHEDYEGVLGTWSFDKDGDTSLTELSIQEIEDGEFKLDRVLDVWRHVGRR